MAANKSQRVAAFMLALMFLLTTIGTSAYVIWSLNQGDGGLVSPTGHGDTSASQQTNNTEAPVQDQGTIANFTGPVTVPELRFEDSVSGSGDTVQPGDSVTIQYTGALASDGSVFDTSLKDANSQPVTFPLANLIPGWQQGIPGMKVGGKRRLYIPSSLGYGTQGSGQAIPPNSDLIFDIELIGTARSN